MNDQDKMTLHFLVSKLVIFAVPLLNNALEVVGIQVSTAPGTVDALTNNLCIALGLAYSWWAHQRARQVHADLGYGEGVEAGFRHGVTATLRGAADTAGKLGGQNAAPPRSQTRFGNELAEASPLPVPGVDPASVSKAAPSISPTSSEPVARRSTATSEANPHSLPPSTSSPTPQPINTPIPPL